MEILYLSQVYFLDYNSNYSCWRNNIFMWLGEQISSRGVGNGISLIITAGIIANLPSAFVSTLQLGRTGELSIAFILGILILILLLIIFIVFVEKAQRRLPVQYPKRQVGNKIYGGQSSHLTLKN